MKILLRDVIESDLQIFFEQQLDPDAVRMAAFPSRDRKSFMAHWEKITTDESVFVQTILFDGQIAGNVVKFEQSGRHKIGYWLGREFWGKGVATQALSAFLDNARMRPLYAHVAKYNIASYRVLEKCGFTVFGEGIGLTDAGGEALEESIFKLE